MISSSLLSRLKHRAKIGLLPFIKSILPSILFKYMSLDSNRIIFISSFGCNFDFNSRYLFEYMVNLEHNELDIKFVINDIEKRQRLTEIYGDYFIDNRTLPNIIYILKAKTWVLSSIDIPVLSPFINNERLVYHLGHGIPLKRIGMNELNISIFKRINRIFRLRNITHILSYSSSLSKLMNASLNVNDAELVYLGQPRNDALVVNGQRLTDYRVSFPDAQFVLYCPTWRPYSKTNFFPFSDFDLSALEDFLEKNDTVIFLRPHPHYSYSVPPGVLNLNRVIIYDNSVEEDIMLSLSEFDLLVTDYSSIYLDYYTLKKPVIFVPYDYEKYNKVVGFGIDYSLSTPGFKVGSFKELKSSLNSHKHENPFYSDIVNINNVTNSKSYGNCEENYNFILSVVNESKFEK